jgi:hypothetical protein
MPRVSKLPRNYTEFGKYYRVQDGSRQESLLKQLERGQSATDFMSIVLMRPWSIPESPTERESMNILDGTLGDLKRLLRVSHFGPRIVCPPPHRMNFPLSLTHSPAFRRLSTSPIRVMIPNERIHVCLGLPRRRSSLLWMRYKRKD